MAKLPTRESLGQAPSGRSGRPIATYDVSAIGKGAQALGKGIAQFGDAFESIDRHNDAVDEFETEKRFKEFQYSRELELDKLKQDMQPGQAGNFGDAWAEGYKKSASEFYATVPDRLKPKYDLKLFETERAGYRDAAKFGRTEQKRVSLASLDDFKSKYLAKPGNLDRGKADYESLVNLNPYLTPIEKDELRKEGLRDLERQHLQGMIERGTDLDTIVKDLGYGVDLDTDVNPELRAKPFSEAEPEPEVNPETRGKGVLLFSPKVNEAIGEAAKKHGVDPGLLATFAKIESGGRPGVQTGSYKGLFQLSNSEFQKHGGEGDIFDPVANADAAAAKLKTETAEFQAKYGRAPAAIDLYMVHQQGEAGYEAHMRNPDAPAWENMASTGEGRQKGDRWAKQAIWGNIPDDMKRRFPEGVESVTSADFVGLWGEKVNRIGGGAGEVRVAQADGPKSDAYAGPYQFLSADDRTKLAHAAQSRIRSSLEGQREQLKQSLDDDVRSIRETGVSTKPDFATAIRVLEPNQVNKYRLDRQEAEMEFNAMNDLPALPEAELQRRLDEIEPKPGEKLYEMKAKVFDKVNKAVNGDNGLRAKREDDPASAVADLPEVKQATLALREDPENPEATLNLARARVDAQAKVGIPEQLRTPITKAEARVMMAPVKNLEGKALQEAFADIRVKLDEQYGPYGRAAARSAIDLVIKNKDLSEELVGMVDKALAGQRISAAAQRRFERIAEIDQAAKAFGPGFEFVGEPHLQMGERRVPSEPGMPFQVDVPQSFGMRQPPQGAIDMLKANPALAPQFNSKYGPGAAESILGE